MNPYKTNTYILAVIPENPVLGALELACAEVKKHFIPEAEILPHIPLMPQFKWVDTEEYLLVHKIKQIIPLIYSFEVQISGFEKDKNQNLIYLSTHQVPSLLEIIETIFAKFNYEIEKQKLPIENIDGKLVLAHQEIKENCFNKVANKLAQTAYTGIFIADKINLLKNDGFGWKISHEFHLD
jgi:hypothetical protein